ncbi:MAG: tetratricopeptide repeat protein, partial [Deltaproteobacteria bacterium]|nr:tetratricopeptide repeat protein [Kofleriaceae bacterium]
VPVRLAGLLQSVGEAHWYAGRLDEALPPLREAIALFDRAYGPDTYDAAGVYLDLAQVLQDQEAYADAEAAVDHAVRVRSRRGPEAGDTAIALSVKASIAGHRGRHAEAIELATRSVEIGATSMPPDDATFLVLRSTLSARLAAAGRRAEALAILDEILATAAKAGIEGVNVTTWRRQRAELARR